MPHHKLREYERKRDFSQTAEPIGGEKTSGEAIFVIQKHHARRLHWDLRLEIDGVLASWAVPKEPTMDKTVRRLAVHVEDHPLDYATFEGEIPKGNYGAGMVEIWDKGVWRWHDDPNKQIAEGKLLLTLLGEKLRGTFGLIKIKPKKGEEEDGDNWLLIKERHDDINLLLGDLEQAKNMEGAKAAEMPRDLTPQLCQTREKPPTNDGWIFEIKWDGYRALAYVEGGHVRFFSRKGNEFHVPHLAKALSKLPDCILDGELVGFDAEGHSSFGVIQEAFSDTGDTAILSFIIFDTLFWDGIDLRKSKLLDRKSVARSAVDKVNHEQVRFSAHAEGNGPALYEQAQQAGLEGIIGKRANSTYTHTRSHDWVKIKCSHRVTALIGGYTLLKDDDGAVGALLLGIRDSAGRILYCGKVGTGFSSQERVDIFRKLAKRKISHHPFGNTPDPLAAKAARWVKPEYEVEVEFGEWTTDGHLRHPRVVGPVVESVTEPAALLKVPDRISSPDRVVDDVSGLTKGALAAYYEDMSPFIYPLMKDRVLVGVRSPEGISGPSFFQKHWAKGIGPGVEAVPIGPDKDDQDYLTLKNPSGLVDLVQMSFIEFHIWGSRIGALDQPDFIVFDLDPGTGVEWEQVRESAREMKQQLENLGLVTFCRTTGGKGLHVVAPIEPELEWDEVKEFCRTVATTFAKYDPKRYIATMSKAARNGRVYIDYLRNGRGATSICSYSVRARPGMNVACPISWDELDTLEGGNAFTVDDARKRVRAPDPWEGYEKGRRSLKNILE
jgi:bifunctional non-homologous end joining protein LigD